MNGARTSVIRDLLAAAANTPLYGLEHPHVRHLLEVAQTSLQEALASKPELTIDVVGNEIVMDSQPQPYDIYLSRCAALLSSRGVRRLRLTSSVSLEELTSLIVGLSLPVEKKRRLVSSENIKLGQTDLEIKGLKEGNRKATTAAEKVLKELAREETLVWRDTQEAVARGEMVPVSALCGIVSRSIDALQSQGRDSVLSSLLETSAFSHAGYVAILTIALAMAVGIKGCTLHEVGIAAMLHDIGKLFLPKEIQSKNDLTEEERKIIREHPVRGSTYLVGVPGVPRLAVLTALEHHMRYSGTGYPLVCVPWKVNSCSHMTMITDFFATHWAFGAGHGRGDLLKLTGTMMKESGTSLHPGLTDIFLAMVHRSMRLSFPALSVGLPLLGLDYPK